MKKSIFIIFLLVGLFVSTLACAYLPPKDEGTIGVSIGTYTVKFVHVDGATGTGTYSIPKQAGRNDDDVIRDVLDYIRNRANATQVYAITHINGVPIEKTKWAEYGGRIYYEGASYQPGTNNLDVLVYVRKERVTFPDTQPVIKNSRTMVPMRAVFEHKNVQAEVTWDEASQTVTAKDRTGRVIIFKIGDANYQVIIDDQANNLTCDTPPYIDNGRTMLPLRALSEGLNFNVNWIDAQKVVDILEKPGYDRKLMSVDQWSAYLQSARQPLQVQGGNSE